MATFPRSFWALRRTYLYSFKAILAVDMSSKKKSLRRDHTGLWQSRLLQTEGVLALFFSGFAIGMLGTGNTFGNTFWRRKQPWFCPGCYPFCFEFWSPCSSDGELPERLNSDVHRPSIHQGIWIPASHNRPFNIQNEVREEREDERSFQRLWHR